MNPIDGKEKTCIKCYKNMIPYAVHFRENGEKLYFCETCASHVNDYDCIDDFLHNTGSVMKKIIQARELREKGESPWGN